MNKWIAALLIVAACGACTGKGGEQSKKSYVSGDKHAAIKKQRCHADTINIDVTSSSLLWRGTKMRRTGKHEGAVSFESGFLLLCNGTLSGGTFIVNMKSIEVTDIPVTDPVPIRNLTAHLGNKDFFDTRLFPTAALMITNVKMISATLQVDGMMTIKNITKPVSFVVTKTGDGFHSLLTFNRLEWNVGYTGSWADRTLVDPEVELEVTIKTR